MVTNLNENIIWYCGIIKFGWGQFSWVVGFLVIRGAIILWMRRFSVSVRKLNFSLLIFAKDVKSLVRATNECLENRTTANSNDSTVDTSPYPLCESVSML